MFCIDKSDTLKCYAEPQTKPAEGDDDDDDDADDDELWKEVNLGQANSVKVHPKSQLEVSISKHGIMVFYQAPDGSLNSITNKGKDWELVGPLSAGVLEGTPLACFVSNEKLLLFYMTQDNCIHYLTKDAQKEEWTGKHLGIAKDITWRSY